MQSQFHLSPAKDYYQVVCLEVIAAIWNNDENGAINFLAEFIEKYPDANAILMAHSQTANIIMNQSKPLNGQRSATNTMGTLLLLACQYRMDSLAAYLLRIGVDANVCTKSNCHPENDISPLMFAHMNNDDDIVRLLLSQGNTLYFIPHKTRSMIRSILQSRLKTSTLEDHQMQKSSSSTPEERAIEIALGQCKSLLSNPKHYNTLLQFMNAEFTRYLNTQISCAGPIEFIKFDDTLFPVPTTENLHSFSRLPELYDYLTILFKKHGLGELVNQSRDVKLFHNPMAHFLQMAIILLAIERGDIQISNIERGTTYFLTPKQILTYPIVMANPISLYSFCMSEGQALGITSLANTLINDFIKRLTMYHNVIKQSLPEYEKLHNFVNALQCLTLPTLHLLETMLEHPLAIYQYSETRKTYRNPAEVIMTLYSHATYFSELPFIPRDCASAATQCNELATKSSL